MTRSSTVPSLVACDTYEKSPACARLFDDRLPRPYELPAKTGAASRNASTTSARTKIVRKNIRMFALGTPTTPLSASTRAAMVAHARR